MAYGDPHRGVTLAVNLDTQVAYMVAQLERLMAQVSGQFYGANNKTMKIQKQWYGMQLLGAGTNLTNGFLHFTVGQKTIYNKDVPDDATDQNAEFLEFTFHIKQNETIVLANNFTSASIYFSTRRGELEKHKVDFRLYGGADIESAIIFRDFLEEVKPQIEAFNADATTLIAQNELDLIPLITSGANGWKD